MNFCFSCGTKLDKGCRFCPECGTYLIEDSTPKTGSSSAQTQHGPENPSPSPVSVENPAGTTNTKDVRIFEKYGFILTNISAVAEKLNVSHDAVLTEIEAFIEGKKRFGVCYKLLDVGDYAFRCSSRRVHLTTKNSVIDFLDILLDAHNDEVRRGAPESTYLFIIGGHEIIPMPLATPRYVTACGLDDRTVNSDLLYASPYGKDAYEAFSWDALFFKYDMLFMPARLPLAEDSSLADLSNYFNRALANGNGIKLECAYAQCDPHWKRMSSEVTSDLRHCRLFPTYTEKIPPSLFFNDIFLTPDICFENETLYKVFNKGANLYFFNLHGCSLSESPAYVGQSVSDEDLWVAGMLPQALMYCSEPNIVVTGACFGGRFFASEKQEQRDLPKSQSMVQAAMSSKTLLFLGASRTAFGGMETATQVPIEHGDVMSLCFFHNLLRGKDAGTSLLEARREFFRHKLLSPASLMTVTEFNLFGDPTLTVRHHGTPTSQLPSRHGTPLKDSSRSLAPRDAAIGFKEEKLSTENTSGSLLDHIRASVNANLAQIRDTITQKLYNMYGVKPRKLSSMFKVKYEDGREHLLLNYELTGNKEVDNQMLVFADSQGNIVSTALSK